MAIPTIETFYAGLVLIALGTGLFKPSISALVGGLYGDNDPRRDSGFSIFYMGINIGGLLAPIVTGFLAQSETFKGWLASNGFDPALSWHWGFAAAGVGMTLALAIIGSRYRLLAAERRRRSRRLGWRSNRGVSCSAPWWPAPGADGACRAVGPRRLHVAALWVRAGAGSARDLVRTLGPHRYSAPRRHLRALRGGDAVLGHFRTGRRRRCRCSPISFRGTRFSALRFRRLVSSRSIRSSSFCCRRSSRGVDAARYAASRRAR